MVVDKEQLKLHFEGDEELIAELIEVFESTYPETLDQVKTAVVGSDFKNLELHAHTLKGMIANFFAEELKNAAFSLEKMGREQKLGNVDQEIETLVKGLPLLVEEVKGLEK